MAYRDAASEGHDDGAVHVHIHSPKLYLGVLGVLVFLTVVTVGSSYIDIDGTMVPGTPHGAGGFNLALAMIIATIKATCVVTWFMHLKDDSRFNALIFVGGVLFACIFFAYTVNDTSRRGQIDRFNGVHYCQGSPNCHEPGADPSSGERAPGGVSAAFAGEEPEEGIAAPEPEPETAPAGH